MLLNRFSIIVATDSQNGISKNGVIPWRSSSDIKFFKDTTMFHNIIMGRKTYDSLPFKNKPLKGRKNIILSKNQGDISDIIIVSSLEDALKCQSERSEVFIIGGAEIYKEAINKYLYLCNKIYVNKFKDDYQCDLFFPFNEISHFSCQMIDHNEYISYIFSPNIIHQEYQYLNLLKRVLDNGESKIDRTKVGTLSIFGERMMFDIRDKIPILTTKKVFYSSIIKELLFFISGKTDTKILEQQNVKIWIPNTRKSFLQERGLDYEEGDYGASYGFQWRHWGAKYEGCNEDYKGKGIDQLKLLIEGIRKDPLSRRHILNAWNVSQLTEMALPPCHLMCQFNVSGDLKYLDCMITIRSNDLFLGAPFNIGSYTILTYMIGHITQLKPRNLIYIMGDAHIYSNHISQVLEQLERTPRSQFPTLSFKSPDKLKEIDDFQYEDFIIHDYISWPAIKGEMAV